MENKLPNQKYYVTHTQLRDLRHYERMFEKTADEIKELSVGENNKMQQGFELGKLHSTLRDQYLHLMQLLNEINNHQTIIDHSDKQW